MRRDLAYWARLRRDRRSNTSAGLAIVAALAAVVALQPTLFPGTPTDVRLSPAYWLLLTPVAWWAAGLTAFEPGPVRFMRRVAVGSPPTAAIGSLLAWSRGADWLPPAILAAVALAAAGASLLLYRGSLLEREGPAR